ncbi:alpha/beta hydrolase [Patulibacter medicamentivorans]|jgi:3-oxoadipate enol-lactonase|uniref:Alpha/beta hydrolase n=1 Tax=Patulibacter medicamentivorans TaxID=1097667 RepID=H0E943_9ACTN|nr:alpha/beta hydrolase [Patulibacter medicamentivorans]EHN09781.1 alpha/beta hydrolase [Patulibacter medicamentivorans]
MHLHVEVAGEGRPVVLLHGLTASHRYVVMGSKRLERSGHRVVAYDARGHGASDPAPNPRDYGYELLVGDLIDVLDQQGIERAVLAGASMGAHTAMRAALEHPDRVAGLVLATPAFVPGNESDPRALARWDRLADGMASGGAEGFVAAYRFDDVPEAWRDTVRKVTAQRLAVHEHPEAVADALRAVPRSAPLDDLAQLQAISVPTTVVGSRDEADAGHPLAVARRYADAIPGARLLVEDEGQSPIAWRGGQLSEVIAEVAEQAEARA